MANSRSPRPSSSSWRCPSRDLQKAALQAFGKPYRIKVTVGTPVNAAPLGGKTARPRRRRGDAAGAGRPRGAAFPRSFLAAKFGKCAI